MAEAFRGNRFTMDRVTLVITPGILVLELINAFEKVAASVVVTMTGIR